MQKYQGVNRLSHSAAGCNQCTDHVEGAKEKDVSEAPKTPFCRYSSVLVEANNFKKPCELSSFVLECTIALFLPILGKGDSWGVLAMFCVCFASATSQFFMNPLEGAVECEAHGDDVRWKRCGRDRRVQD